MHLPDIIRLNRVNEESKRRGGGFTKLCSLSPELQDFVGESELARTEVMFLVRLLYHLVLVHLKKGLGGSFVYWQSRP